MHGELEFVRILGLLFPLTAGGFGRDEFLFLNLTAGHVSRLVGFLVIQVARIVVKVA